MKKVWLTSLGSSEDSVKKLIAQMKTYGLEVHGHFWEDDLDKMAWMKVRDVLLQPDVALWAILGSSENLQTPSVRYGLSVLTMTLRAARGQGFPIVVLQTEGDAIAPETLTTPLENVVVLPESSATLGAKLVAKLHAAPKGEEPSEYRMDLYGNEQIGQWFEVGPVGSSWPGGMFAVCGGEITFHGVGPKGHLPSKSVLNYPVQGLKLSLGEMEYTAWAVQNELDDDTSYFVQVKGSPESILFGPYSNEEDADMYRLALQ